MTAIDSSVIIPVAVVVMVAVLVILIQSAEIAALRSTIAGMGRGTGKECPRCGSEMSDLRSQFRRVCACRHEEEWSLDAGQKPLLGSPRDRRVEK